MTKLRRRVLSIFRVGVAGVLFYTAWVRMGWGWWRCHHCRPLGVETVARAILKKSFHKKAKKLYASANSKPLLIIQPNCVKALLLLLEKKTETLARQPVSKQPSNKENKKVCLKEKRRQIVTEAESREAVENEEENKWQRNEREKSTKLGRTTVSK